LAQTGPDLDGNRFGLCVFGSLSLVMELRRRGKCEDFACSLGQRIDEEKFQRNASKHKIPFLQCACLSKAEAHLLKQ
jgi:hypothetical protein